MAAPRGHGAILTLLRYSLVTHNLFKHDSRLWTERRVGAWSNRSFRRLWVASTVSSFGSEVAELALPLLALLTLSASASEVGLLRVAQFLPFLLATLPLGVLVDRRRRQRLSLMIGADLGRFVLVATIPITVWVGVAQIELLYVVVFAAGILTVLYQIADFAFCPAWSVPTSSSTPTARSPPASRPTRSAAAASAGC